MSQHHQNHQPDHSHEHSFHCPEVLPASVPDTRFGTPFVCQRKIPTPRFSAPTSGLPPAETERLVACIEEVNHLLLTLALENDPDEFLDLQHRFRQLRHESVQVNIECGDQTKPFKGKLDDSGKDFLIIHSTHGKKTLLPFQRICSVKHSHTGAQHQHHPELQHIDEKLRRQLVLHFGQVVSKSPFLINLFFGLSLELFLLCFIGQSILVAIDHKGKIKKIKGKLIDSEEQQIKLLVYGQRKSIHLDEVCFIQVSHMDESEEEWLEE